MFSVPLATATVEEAIHWCAADGRRVVAVTTDHATMREICTDGWDHHRAEVHTNGTTNTVEG